MDNNDQLQQVMQNTECQLSSVIQTTNDSNDIQINPMLGSNNKVSFYIKGRDLAQGRDKIMLDEAGRRNAVEIGIKIRF